MTEKAFENAINAFNYALNDRTELAIELGKLHMLLALVEEIKLCRELLQKIAIVWSQSQTNVRLM